MNSKAKTAVYAHMEECAHHNTPENFSTLVNNRSANEYSLQVQESILIARHNPDPCLYYYFDVIMYFSLHIVF